MFPLNLVTYFRLRKERKLLIIDNLFTDGYLFLTEVDKFTSQEKMSPLPQLTSTSVVFWLAQYSNTLLLQNGGHIQMLHWYSKVNTIMLIMSCVDVSKKVNRRLSKLLLIVSRKVVCFYLSDDLFIEKISRHDSFERHFKNDYTISRSSSTIHVKNLF